jgi:hypothetical protein
LVRSCPISDVSAIDLNVAEVPEVAVMLFFLRFGVPAFKGAIIAALMIVFIQISFVSLLRVPLPRGILDRLLW